MPLSWLLFAVICAIGVVGYYLGRSVGREEGYERGYMRGHREGQRNWIRAMEQRRGADGQDELVGIIDRYTGQRVRSATRV